jgi:hypothetical protein
MQSKGYCFKNQMKLSLSCLFKVLTNEKRGGLNRFTFKLFTLRSSNNSVQALSSERPKTTQQTLFLSFEINNCLQITAWCRAATHFSHHTLNWNKGIAVLYILPDIWEDGKNRNFIKIFSNNATIPSDIWSFGKELIAQFELSTWLPSFPDFLCTSDTIALLVNNYCLLIIETSLSSFRPLTRWELNRLFENFSVNSLKWNLSNNITVNPPLFSLVNTFKQLKEKILGYC